MRYLLKGGLLYGESPADILIEDGKVVEIGEVSKGADEVIDVKGRYVLPALTDPHVHAREPGQEYKEDLASVSAAAVSGGYSYVAVMPNTVPPIDNPELLRALRRKAESLPAYVLFVAAITKGREGKELVEMGLLKEEGAVGFSDDGDWVSDPSVMFNALTYAGYLGLPVITHAEVPELARGFAHYDTTNLKYGMRFRMSLAEELAVYRDVRMAEITGAHIHIAHVSARETVELVEKFKAKGVRVTAEVTPHHLVFSTGRFPFYDPTYRVNPPIRSEGDRLALVKALKEGVIDFVATDHAPHAPYEKEAPLTDALPGIEGLETAFSALYTHLVVPGELPFRRLVEVMAERPAQFLGLKATIEVGEEANLFVFDQDVEWVVSEEDLASRSRNNPFLGSTLKGRVLLTFAKGRLAYRR